MKNEACRRECQLRTVRDHENDLTIGSLRDVLEMAATKLEEAGQDTMFIKLFLRRNVGAEQMSAARNMREALEQGRQAVYALEAYIESIMKDLDRANRTRPENRPIGDETRTFYDLAIEKLTIFRALDGHPEGILQSDQVPFTSPKSLGMANKLAICSRALLSMDALIFRYTQYFHSSIHEVVMTAKDMIPTLHTAAYQDGHDAFTALGIDAEWLGGKDRTKWLRKEATIRKQLHVLEENHTMLTIRCDDYEEHLAKANERLVAAGLEPVKANWRPMADNKAKVANELAEAQA